MKYNIKNVILIIICLFLSSYLVKSEAIINDTTIDTDLVSLPVYGSTKDWSNQTITYTFKVSWARFDLLDVVADANSAILNNDITYRYDWQTNLITVTTNNIKPNFDGVLFNIVVKVLTRVDYYTISEVFTITPMEIIISDANNSTSISLGTQTASVSLNYVQADLTYRSDVSLNYPNPFNNDSRILFSLSDSQPVNIAIYNPLGNLVQQIPGKSGEFNYELTSSTHNTISIEDNNMLDKGLYCLRLIRTNRLSDGIYYLVVRIGNNSRLIKMGVN